MAAGDEAIADSLLLRVVSVGTQFPLRLMLV